MKRPLSLVLGSGGARGFSFIGALQALDEAQLSISHIVGSSMGALIGAGYCSGRSPEELTLAARSFSLRQILRFDPFGQGLFTSRELQATVERVVDAKYFETLHVPLTVVCTDFQAGSRVLFDSGPLIPPVVGSCLVAGAFSPMLHEGRYLVDGGYTDPVPVAAAADNSFIIAVDPCVAPDWHVDLEPLHALANLAKLGKIARQIRKASDTLIFALVRERLRLREHVLVVPQLETMTFLDFGRSEWAIQRGYEAMRAALPVIKANMEAQN